MKPRLLIADSDAELRDMFRRYFSASGFDIAMADDGLECLEQFRQFLPDVLVVEREMPWGGGDGVLGRLREEYPLLAIDVVITTDDGRDFDPAPPVIACLEKPFSLASLLEVIRAGNKHLC